MKITDLLYKQEIENVQELEILLQQQARKIIGGTTPWVDTYYRERNRNAPSLGCPGAGGDPDNFINNRASF